MPSTQLLIFDCDGVLVDSEPLSNQVIAEEITVLGFPMTTKEAIGHFAGGSIAKVVQYIEKELGGIIPYDFEVRYRKRTYALFEEALQPVAGIRDALNSIELSRCVASNGPIQKMKFNLRLTKLLHNFEGRLFSAYEVDRWKPDPFLFLHAAKTMKVAPENCLVVEDSVHGVQAAVAAGIPVLGFAPHGDSSVLEAAGAYVFTDMVQLPSLINSFEAK